MLSTISSQLSFYSAPNFSEAAHATHFIGHLNVNREKLITFSNTILILAGIAYAFFMKLPLIAVGLAAYGITYLILQNRIQQSRPSETQIVKLQSELEVEREKYAVLGEKINKNLSAKGTSADLEEDIKTKTAKLGKLNADHNRLSKEVDKVRAERDAAKDELKTMNLAFEKFARAAKSAKKGSERYRVIQEIKNEVLG